MASATEAPASSMAEGPTSHTQNQAARLSQLRVPFDPSQVQALPKILCKQCSESRTKVCENPRHAKSKCKVCDNFITQAHLHLDYVGHAELTHRLLDVDPLWDWEPLAIAPNGLPQFDENGGLWIRLTVCGKSRLGYGDSQGKRGPNAVKEAIGDALRNAAMRFGAALNLWAKSDLTEAKTEHPQTEEEDYKPSPRSAAPAATNAAAPPAATPAKGGPAPAMSDEERAGHLNRLVGQFAHLYREGSRNPMPLIQIKGDAEKHGVLDDEVQGPPPGREWMTMRKLIDARIAELNQTTKNGQERGVA